MKNIINRKNFIKESNFVELSDYNSIKKLIYTFIDSNNLSLSFRSGYFKENYVEDTYNLEKYLKKYNIYLNEFMTLHSSKIYNDDFFTYNTGFLDALLYTYNNNFPLSGDKLQDYGTGDEHVIKYEYRYEDYDLGRKYLFQNYTDLEDFYYDCASKLVDKFGYIYTDGISENKNSFSLADKKNGFSICVINFTKLKKFIFNDFPTSIMAKHLEKEIKNFQYKYSNFYNQEIYIIGFGKNMDLELSRQEIKDYIEKIDVQENMEKYNV